MQKSNVRGDSSIVGWSFVVIGHAQGGDNRPPPVLQHGKVLSEIGNASWLLHIDGHLPHVVVANEERLASCTFFPNEEVAQEFLKRFYAQWTDAGESEGDAPETPPAGASDNGDDDQQDHQEG